MKSIFKSWFPGKILLEFNNYFFQFSGFDHETKFICDQCSSEFLSAKYLAQHIALTHTVKKVLAESTEKYQCEQCETDFDYKNENLMMKHYFEVHGTIPQKFENLHKYFCDHCPKLLTSEQARNL